MAMKTYLVSGNQANYTDAEFSAIQSLIYSVGVFDNDGLHTNFQVVENAPQNLSVDVLAGNILIPYEKNGVTWNVIVNSPATENLTISANNSGSNRVDAVVMHLTQSDPNSLKNNVAELRVITGTGIAALSDGDIDTELGDSNWYRLANVTVPNADSTIEDANIADTRSRISYSNRIQDIYTNRLIESVSGEGIDIDNVVINEDAADFLEKGAAPSTPTTGRWKIYFKASGPYVIDDAGVETKIATGGTTIDRKAPGAAAAGEAFENSEDNTLAFKDNQDAPVNIGPGGIYGETITKGDPLGWLGLIDKGVTQYAPSHDTYVNQTSPATNYDASLTLQSSNDAGNVKYPMFKFSNLLSDLGISANQIHQIHSFTFNVYRSAAGGANSHEIRAIKSAWTSATVTFNTIPSFDGSSVVTPVATSSTGYISFNSNANLQFQQSKWILDNGFLIRNGSVPIHTWSALGAANPPYLTNLVYTGVDGKLHIVKGSNGPLLTGFMGIAPMDGVLDDTHAILGKGTIYHATGTPFTAGETYYVSDSGSLSTTPGTFEKEIGKAISNNQLFIEDGPAFLGEISISPSGTLPKVETLNIPRGCNMIVARAQSPSETSRAVAGGLTLMKGGYSSMERFDSGVWMITSLSWSGDILSVTFSGSGAVTSGSAYIQFYKI